MYHDVNAHYFCLSLYTYRFTPRSIMNAYDQPDEDHVPRNWRYRHSSSIYRIELIALMKAQLQLNAQLVIDILIPDFLTGDGVNNYDSCILNHLMYCLLTNPQVDTNAIENWIVDRCREGVPLSLHTLPLSCQQRIHSYLTSYDIFQLNDTNKTLSDLCGNNGFESDSYKRWCSLTFNRDNLKDIFIKYITPEILIDLILSDVRALSVYDLVHLIGTVRDNNAGLLFHPSIQCSKPSTVTTTQCKNSVVKPAIIYAFPPKALSILASFLTEDQFLQCLSINLDWARAFLSSDVLRHSKHLFKEIKFTDKHYRRWDFARSSWFLFEGATRMNYIVSKSVIEECRPNKVPLFRGNNLCYYRGSIFHVNVRRSNLSRLRFLACLPKSWDLVITASAKFTFYHKSWYKLCDFFVGWCDYIDYFYVAGNYVEGFDLSMESTHLLMDKGVMDHQTLSTILNRNGYAGVYLHNMKLIDSQTHYKKRILNTLYYKPHLLCFDCENLHYLTEISSLLHIVKYITIVKKYSDITNEECKGLVQLMGQFSTTLFSPTLTVIFYHSYDTKINLFNNIGGKDSSMDKFWPLVVNVWSKIIKHGIFAHVYIGFVMVNQIVNAEDHHKCNNQECMIDVTMYETKQELREAGDQFRRLFGGASGDDTKPVTRFCKKLLHDFDRPFMPQEWAEIGMPMLN